tara:strand:- start:146 stop:517 length:372 start_codon:yes stop_codon:yes gene_type:complete
MKDLEAFNNREGLGNLEELKSFNELCHNELISALETVYPIRDRLQQTLIDTHDEGLLDKIIKLDRIIKDAEILLTRKEDIKKFYAERHPDYVDENNDVNERGLFRIQLLKKKWKTLGYLGKNS